MKQVVAWVVTLFALACGVAVPLYIATQTDPRVGIPIAVIIGAALIYLVVLLVSYKRRGGK